MQNLLKDFGLVTSLSSAELSQSKKTTKTFSLLCSFHPPFIGENWEHCTELYTLLCVQINKHMVTIFQYHYLEPKNRDRQYKESEKNNKMGVDLDLRTGLEKLRPKRPWSASNQPRTSKLAVRTKKYREYKNAEWTRFYVSAEKSKYSVFLGTVISLSSIVVSRCCLVLVHMYGYLRYMSQQLTWAKYRISSQPHICIRWGPKYRMG